MKKPDKIDRQDVETALLSLFCSGRRVNEAMRMIDEARLDRLIADNLREQKELTGRMSPLTREDFLAYHRKWEALSKIYNRLMLERFGDPA